ncbi:glycoprotein 3-alpha-L-fucosyltransferase A-like [Watersipora subatra]|uniref:glycoprotein 3-alpha-L-fucosyltransferase A-like n=1 Tax=Watersipora subatra TaxID=2589382 RepID=UPI00355C2C03
MYGNRENRKKFFQAMYHPVDKWFLSKNPENPLDGDSSRHFFPNQTSEMTDHGKRKLIVSIDNGGPWLLPRVNFDRCEYSNCDFIYSPDNISYAQQADALIFVPNTTQSLLQFPRAIRQRQLWFVASMEPPAYPWHRFNKVVNNFNGSMTYLRNSTPSQFFYGCAKKERAPIHQQPTINYSKSKTKGAFAYVSHCGSKQYDRLSFMRQLKKYINVDIFGRCTKQQPCLTRFDIKCEANKHYPYRFYLAFENSLCTEYITEKFWKTLSSKGNLVPVALGGLSVQEYTDIAPPDSFIHVYNFSSVKALGKYLQHLMTDDAAYNRYHEWRQHYSVSLVMGPQVQVGLACGLCKSINHPESLHEEQNRQFADERNDENNCKSLSIPAS